MAIVRCEQGKHFYDNTRFDKCPHCGVRLKSFRTGNSNPLNDQVTIAKYTESEELNAPYVHYAEIPVAKINLGNADNDRTVGFYSSMKGNDFVTGWLVCIQGPERGRDYRLHHGFNKIGRGTDMDVFILEDEFISKNSHCSVIYEAKKSQFYISPSGGNLTYLNGEMLTDSKPLKNGDLIVIGQTTLEFVPFCRAGRNWGENNEIDRQDKKRSML